MAVGELLGSGILVFDGAMGTLLQDAGLPAGECPDVWCVTNPGAVVSAHRSYSEAGAQIVETNTFGATPIRLSRFGHASMTCEINRAAVRLAREAVGGRAMVAGSIGPLGVLVEPLGTLPFDEAYEQFAAQVKALREEGPDFLIIETISDLNEMRTAILACKDWAPDVPLVAQMTIDPRGRSYTGTSPETAAIVMQSMGADIIGLNCSVGPDIMVEAIRRMATVARVPISVQPNAGLPRLKEGKTVFPMGPREFASYAPRLVGAGASVVGGCCGTTPEHIRLVREALVGVRPPQVGSGAYAKELTLSSRTRALVADPEKLPFLIGERLNPTGRKALARDIKEGSFEIVRRDAKAQVASGASVLDINVGVPLVDEASAMRRAVEVVQEITDVPASIDSVSPEAIEAGLRAFVGKALINSVTAEKKSMDALLPLAKRYGAAIIGLTLDESGLPSTVKERVRLAKVLVDSAASYGIPPYDVVIDPLALTAGAQQDQAMETLRAIREIKELGCRTSLGISNVSFGLPNRQFLNAVYLTMALSYGLDMAIVNPMDERTMDTVRAVRVFMGRDTSSKEYISKVGAKTLEHASIDASAPQSTDTPSLDLTATPRQGGVGAELREAVLEGHKEGIVGTIEKALREGIGPFQILNDHLIPAINETGRLFAEGIYFLPQLMLSAAAMKAAFERLQPAIAEVSGDVASRGTVILATVQGDVHDIGKNIVSVLLENHGFAVVDLGRDVSADAILAEARKARADVVCLSALMTTTMPRMKEVVDLFAREGFTCPILVGGAATTKAFADEIGASGYGRDAQEAVSEVLRVLGERAFA